MHARRSPIEHQWIFPYCFYAIDLDELPELDRTVRGFGYNRWQPVALHDRDYLNEQGQLREQLSQFIDLKEINCIILITVARFLTRVFNPVSFYYCLRQDGSPACMVAEVNNTFGERHLYIMESGGDFPVQCQSNKQFHVSPFNDMQGRYEFSFSEPGDQINISIRLSRDGETVMDASMWGSGEPLTTGNLWKTMLRHPVNAWMTMPRILWQAALLHYRKKMPVFRKPPPTHPMTIKEHA